MNQNQIIGNMCFFNQMCVYILYICVCVFWSLLKIKYSFGGREGERERLALYEKI